MYPIEILSARREFLELTQGHGVLDVVRVSADTIHVFLSRELWPGEMKVIREVAQEWWNFDRIVVAVDGDLRGLGNTKRAG